MRWKWIIARHLARDRTRVTSRVRDVLGCTLDMDSCPTPNIVIDIDACESEDRDLANCLRSRRHCDFLLMSGDESSLNVILIEVTSSSHPRKIPDKIEQIVSSKILFDELNASCGPPAVVATYHGVVVSNVVRRSGAQRIKLNDAGKLHGINMRLAMCGNDIWVHS